MKSKNVLCYPNNFKLLSERIISTLMTFVSTLLIGCSTLFSGITYYDNTTYKNLTDLKPQVELLYDSFGTDAPDTEGIKIVRLRFAQMNEYEKGKGKKNDLTVDQVKKLQSIVETDIKDRLENKKWPDKYLTLKKNTVLNSFDMSIQTENSKNKN